MGSLKIDRIKRMMNFLNYKDNESFLMTDIILNEASYPSCNNKGEFFLNAHLSSHLLAKPPNSIVEYAYDRLRNKTLKEIDILKNSHHFPNLERPLKHFYNLNFLDT